MYAASELGDFSLVWHLVDTGRALAPDRRLIHAVRVAADPRRGVGAGERPREEPVPAPPAGLGAGAAAAPAPPAHVELPLGPRLRGHDRRRRAEPGRPLWPLYYAIGAVVAGSRVYVKIHHPSDVVAGAILGVVLARVAWWAWPLHAVVDAARRWPTITEPWVGAPGQALPGAHGVKP